MWKTLKAAWAWVLTKYQTNLKFRGLVQSVEAAIVAALIAALTNGIDFSKKGLAVLISSIGSAVIVAVRNFLINPPGSPPGPVAPPASQKVGGE